MGCSCPREASLKTQMLGLPIYARVQGYFQRPNSCAFNNLFQTCKLRNKSILFLYFQFFYAIASSKSSNVIVLCLAQIMVSSYITILFRTFLSPFTYPKICICYEITLNYCRYNNLIKKVLCFPHCDTMITLK